MTEAKRAVRTPVSARTPATRPWSFFAGVLMLAYLGTSVALYAPLQNVLPRMIESAAGSQH